MFLVGESPCNSQEGLFTPAAPQGRANMLPVHSDRKPHQLLCCHFRGRGTHAWASVARVRAADSSRLDHTSKNQARCFLELAATETSKGDEN